MAILLDLDGTLTDPRAGFVDSVRYAFDRLGVAAPSDDEIASWIGPPLQETLGQFLGGDSTEAVRLYRVHYGQIGLFECRVYPGIVESLERLRREDLPLFVATSKPTLFAGRILDRFDLSRFFDGVYGSELDGTRSNKAELIGYVLKMERVQPGTTIMVGDREHDVVGARASGLPCLGVTYGYGTAEELDEAGAAALCAHPGRVGESALALLDRIALTCEGI